MSADQRRRRMVGYLPPVLQSGAKIHRFFDSLAQELETMEGGLTRLMRSRWYSLARGFAVDATLLNKADSELGRIALLYGVSPRRGESDAYLRERLAAMVELHRTGLASAPALLRLVSLVYMAKQPPRIVWEGDTAVGLFSVPRADGTYRDIRIELADNPEMPASSSFRNVSRGQRLLTTNQGLETARVEISLKATEREIAVPILRHEQSGLDVIFLGRIPLGSTLLLRDGRPPILDGRPVDTPIILAHPTRFAGPNDVGVMARFDMPEARFSVFKEDLHLPELPPGESHWTYDTLERPEVRSYLFGWSIERQQAAEAQALPVRDTPRAELRFAWTEITPATCTLRIPANHIPPHLLVPNEEGVVPGLPGLVKELAAALEYGRCAGVRTRIELTLPMPSESLLLQERPLQLEVSASFGETLHASDELTSFGSHIALHEQFPEPQEKLTWDGVFNGTRFDTSRFQP
ncbi:hypothetical protein MYSTI_04387 [Myxococcus stipitatus DSM 14675]|uniref:Uncharacterized protein n=1 Tax=Myxococcus stipitatus (strain DSM 14675 / JCM 12634 / Mx s8) TaxID=1278073 RepID=L7UC87_MYXSD|nr:hypothetical protein [Myxococcus stipitatus]AGC45683.1 hypothetical protein MYSTI_04387 [Myxococcus stipitatus DSM 14675]